MSGAQRLDGRWRRLKELATSVILRLAKRDFASERKMVAIVGDHIGDQIRARGFYERDQLEFLRDHILDLGRCRTQVALDVGANIGNHSLFLSDLFRRVVAFEPNPLARSILDINLRLNGISNVEVRPVGLSDQPSNAYLSVPAANLGGARLVDELPGTSRESTVPVELVCGDEVVGNDEPIGLIKIDVEGGEAAALSGLRNTILYHQPIIVLEQLSTTIDRSSGQSPSFMMLRELGYRAWELRPAGGMNKIAKALGPILSGGNPLQMTSLETLDVRDYPALIFLPGTSKQ